MRRVIGLLLSLSVVGTLLVGCRSDDKTPIAQVLSPQTHDEPPSVPRQSVGAREGAESAGESSPGLPDIVPPAPAAERIWGTADRDPQNDDVVAPPDEVPGCHRRLAEKGLDFTPSHLPLREVVREVPTCGCHDAVVVKKTPSGMRLVPPAAMSCQLALALVGLDELIQELAREHLNENISSLHHGGTYSCRKMARFDLVSEHSYGNAIDVRAFTTESGKTVSVLLHYGRLDARDDALSPRGRFLRKLASGAYDRDLVSVSLSPFWDALHKDHFHFDMARYRVDGSRQRQNGLGK